ncbi:MAG: COX15/CtaA family protein [Ilumatobacteraceae bacterium]
MREQASRSPERSHGDVVVDPLPSTYRRVTIGALIALSSIIVTGASVRLTNSGLGCDDWPNCNSERLIDMSSTHAAIEQVNRLLTGVVVVAVAAAVLGSHRQRPRRRDLIWWSWSLVVGVFANAFLGAVTVWVDLHPYAVQGHLLLSLMLVGAGITLVRRAGEPADVPRRTLVTPRARALVWLVALGTSLAVVTGTVVTGAGPHAGDEDAVRLDVEIPTVARIHGVSVIATIGAALALVWVIRRDRRDIDALRGSLSRWMFLAVLQAVVGYVQYLTGVPAILVGSHVAGATAVTLAASLLVLDTRRPVLVDRRPLAAPDPVVTGR